jgi:hypothetical protein
MKHSKNSAFGKLRTKLRQLQSETFFITTGIPGIVSPMASLNNMATGLKAMQISSNALKKGAVTACDCARSVCKPVDDLLKRPSSPYAYNPYRTYSGYSQPQYTPVLQSSYAPQLPPMIDLTADNPVA